MHRFQGMVIRFHISWDRSKCVIYSNIYWLRDSLLSSLCMDSVIINSKILYRASTSLCIWKLSIIDLSCFCFFVSMIERLPVVSNNKPAWGQFFSNGVNFSLVAKWLTRKMNKKDLIFERKGSFFGQKSSPLFSFWEVPVKLVLSSQSGS